MAMSIPPPVSSSNIPPPPPSRDPARRAAYLDSVRAERKALGAFTVVAIAAIVWIARPIGIGILLGTLIAFSLQPLYERVVERTKRPALTALGFVIVSTVTLLATIGAVTSLFIT